MKYNLVEIINKFLKDHGLEKLREEEEDIINDINDSTFPELDGLKLYKKQIITEQLHDVPVIEIFLNNKNEERLFRLRITDNEVSLEENIDGRNDFYLKYSYEVHKYGDKPSKKNYYVSSLAFINDNDIISYNSDGEKTSIAIYNNAGDAIKLVKKLGVPDELVKDGEYFIRYDAYGSAYAYTNPEYDSKVEANYNEKRTKLMRIRNICENVQIIFYEKNPYINKQKILK